MKTLGMMVLALPAGLHDAPGAVSLRHGWPTRSTLFQLLQIGVERVEMIQRAR